MAGALMHSVEIQAEPRRVYEALATGEGLASFWTRDSKAEPRTGTVAEFGFGGPRLRMRVDELAPDRRVRWTTLGDFPNWEGTTVAWDLKAADGKTEVQFAHDGWAAELPQRDLASVNYTWAQILGRLKAFAESGRPDPYFP